MENEVAWLNENFRLPYNVTIEAVECSEANAFYIPSEKKVQICYEYIDNLDELLLTIREHESYATLDDFVFDVTYSVLYHEVAHAILDVYDIPYTGLEENVADQFEALMLSRTEGGQDMLYNVGDLLSVFIGIGGADTILGHPCGEYAALLQYFMLGIRGRPHLQPRSHRRRMAA